MKYYIFLLYIILLVGCKTKPSETNKEIQTLNVDLDKASSSSLYDIFSSIDIIPLKTPDTIVCSGGKTIIHKNNLFLWDRRQQSILCFDTLGNYRHMIKKSGRGPEEYSDILSFFIDKYSDYIVILDRHSTLQFDFEGNFKHKIKNPEGLVIHSAEMLNKDTIVCLTTTANDNKRHIINYLSLKENKNIASCYTEDPIFPVNRDLTPYDDKLFYAIHKDAAIYSLNDLQLTPEYKWDFGKYNYSYRDLNIPKFEDWNKMQKIQLPWIYNNCPWLIIGMGENKIYHYLSISLFKNTTFPKQVPEFHIFWHKQTGDYKVISEFKEGRFLWESLSTTDKVMYRTTDLNYVSEYIDLKSLTPENRKILQELPEDANPVLIKYTFK